MDFVFGIIAVAGLVALLWFVRKAYRNWIQDEPEPPTGFTLGTLRALHKKGQLTTAEFEAAKGMIIEGARKAATAIPPNKNFQPKGVGFTGGFPVKPSYDPPTIDPYRDVEQDRSGQDPQRDPR